jgi:hypothetical protein
VRIPRNIDKKCVIPKSKGLTGRDPEVNPGGIPELIPGFFRDIPGRSRSRFGISWDGDLDQYLVSGSCRGPPRITHQSQKRTCQGPGRRADAKSKNPKKKFTKFHSTFAFMSLGGELVTFPHIQQVHEVHPKSVSYQLSAKPILKLSNNSSHCRTGRLDSPPEADCIAPVTSLFDPESRKTRGCRGCPLESALPLWVVVQA